MLINQGYILLWFLGQQHELRSIQLHIYIFPQKAYVQAGISFPLCHLAHSLLCYFALSLSLTRLAESKIYVVH